MKRLHLSPEISLPLDVATSTVAIIAIRGAGKSYTAAVMAEEMIGNGIQTVVIDPTGAWWGLRSSADGKSAGLPVIVMGGNHGDVPLEDSAGEVVAEFIVESRASVILDLSLMRKNAQKRFMADFAEHLYHLKAKTQYQTPLHVYMDEADRFAPQKPQPEHARLLGAIEDIVRLGRSRGFGITSITQRAAVLNKDVLTQTETLIVLRTTSPQDRKAMGEWVQENATEEEFKLVADSLSSLPNGTAWVWSPAFLKVLKKIKVRTRRTFNSSATPKVGERRIEPKVVAPVDLDALKGRIADSIERVKSNDPRALRLEVSMLKTLLAEAQDQAKLKKPHVYTKEKRVEVPVLKDAHVNRIEIAICRAEEVSKKTLAALAEASRLIAASPWMLRKNTSPPDRPAWQSAISGTVTKSLGRHMSKAPTDFKPLVKTSGGLRSGERTILSLLASKGTPGMTRTQVATLAGIKPGGSTFSTYVGVLRRAGLIEEAGPDCYVATAAGLAESEGVDSFPTAPDDIVRLWSSKLREGERIMLDVVVSDPEGRGRTALAACANIDPNGSTFSTYLGVLRRNGLVVVDKHSGLVKRNPEVFGE